MRRTSFLRRWRGRLLPVLGILLLWPVRASAGCSLKDPGCFIDTWWEGQQAGLAVLLWDLNAGGLIVAQWLTQFREWLLSTVLVSAFTSLMRPVGGLFIAALIAATMLYGISLFLQSIIEARWVEVRRALRWVALAGLLFQTGGPILLTTYQAQQIGYTLVQDAARSAVTTVQMPGVATAPTGDMGEVKDSIYAGGLSCGGVTIAPPISTAPALNTFAARYLFATAADIHCQGAGALPEEFAQHYYPMGNDISNLDGGKRAALNQRAMRGIERQATGVFLVVGAIVEQVMQLLFALSMALIWFGILLTLTIAVFLPGEQFLMSQLAAMWSVLRASIIATFVLSLGMSTLTQLAAAGNGIVVLFAGLGVSALALLQARQALTLLWQGLSSVGSAVGNVPGATAKMVGGWAATAGGMAMLARQGELGATVAEEAARTVRRAGRHLGDGPVSGMASRMLANKAAAKLDALAQDRRLEHQAEIAEGEAQWYQRGEYAGAGDFAADVQGTQRREAAQERERQTRAQLLNRKAQRALAAGDYAEADRLRNEAEQVRRAPTSSPTMEDVPTVAQPTAAQPLEAPLDVALATDPALRGAEVQHQRRTRNQLLSSKDFVQAQTAIAQVRELEALGAAGDDVDAQLRAYDEAPQHYAWVQGRRGAPLDGRTTYALSYPETAAGAQVRALDRQLQDVRATIGTSTDPEQQARLRQEEQALLRQRAQAIMASGQRSRMFPSVDQLDLVAEAEAELAEEIEAAMQPVPPAGRRKPAQPPVTTYPESKRGKRAQELDTAIREAQQLARRMASEGTTEAGVPASKWDIQEMQGYVEGALLERAGLEAAERVAGRQLPPAPEKLDTEVLLKQFAQRQAQSSSPAPVTPGVTPTSPAPTAAAPVSSVAPGAPTAAPVAGAATPVPGAGTVEPVVAPAIAAPQPVANPVSAAPQPMSTPASVAAQPAAAPVMEQAAVSPAPVLVPSAAPAAQAPLVVPGAPAPAAPAVPAPAAPAPAQAPVSQGSAEPPAPARMAAAERLPAVPELPSVAPVPVAPAAPPARAAEPVRVVEPARLVEPARPAAPPAPARRAEPKPTGRPWKRPTSKEQR